MSSKKRQRKLTDFLPEAPSKKSKSGEKWEEVDRDGLKISIRQDFYDSSSSRRLFSALEKEVEYLEGDLSRVLVFGKWHPIPRKHVAYGDPGVHYKFSSRMVSAKPWTPSLCEIREDLFKTTGYRYNFVLVNRYENGTQKMGEHKDNEKEIDKNIPIASLSFGQERDFIFRRESDTKPPSSFTKYKLSLKSGSCLLMHFPTNETWVHGLPPRKSATDPRINLMFRQINS